MKPYMAEPVHWDEVGERRILRPKLMQKTLVKIPVIKQRILTAQSR